ncbi:uncharacterized protein LOC121394176 [Xenopus laevis]|uniref:Uncharacterized protein LOC121394176 n=1 Tax=Xenopus laevis TaxID=8355 RepID=A0A8J1KSL4_XENLA|nr:uncharacterized protein LOC121394176 [Xenopus laevis]
MRLDMLVCLLTGKVEKYYKHLTELHKAGRISSSQEKQDIFGTVEKMIQKGLEANIHHKGEGNYCIPSESQPAKYHNVNVIYNICDCWFSLMGNICKHIAFAKTLLSRENISLDQLRKSECNLLIKRRMYIQEGATLIINRDDEMSIVHKSKCSCRTNSFGETCVCIMFAIALKNSTSKPTKHTAGTLQAVDELKMSKPAIPFQDTFEIEEELDTVTPTVLSTQNLVQDLYTWVNSESFAYNKALHNTLKKAHAIVFSNFETKSRKKNIVPIRFQRAKLRENKNIHSSISSYRRKKKNYRKGFFSQKK